MGIDYAALTFWEETAGLAVLLYVNFVLLVGGPINFAFMQRKAWGKVRKAWRTGIVRAFRPKNKPGVGPNLAFNGTTEIRPEDRVS